MQSEATAAIDALSLAEAEGADMRWPAFRNPLSRTNYIYIDYENVTEVDLGLIAEKPVKVILAIGPHVRNLPVELVAKMLEFAGQVRLLKSVTAGKNALDLLITVDLGRERERDPGGYFHIYSKDRHFDSVVKNLRAQGTLIERRESLSHIPILMKAEERLTLLVERLGAPGAGRPASRAALERHIQAQFNRSLSATQLAQVLEGLQRRKVISWNPEGGIRYLQDESELPASSKPVPPPPSAPSLAPKPLPNVEERARRVREALARVPNSRPGRESTLRAFVANVLGREVSEGAMKKTIAFLQANKALSITAAGKVEYPP